MSLLKIGQSQAEAVSTIDSKIEINTKKLEALKKVAPAISDAREAFLTYKKNSLNANSKEPMYFRQRLHFLEYFLAVDRDKLDPRVEEITPDDLTAHFALLPYIPKHHTALPSLRTRSVLACAKLNAALPKKKRYKGLGESTAVDQYVDKYKSFFNWAARRYGIPDPFLVDAVAIPHFDDPPHIRMPLRSEKLNALFKVAAEREEPAEVWIPLLAFFTGARLGELVYLQKKDVRLEEGRWVIDLTRHILIEDDEEDDEGDETDKERGDGDSTQSKPKLVAETRRTKNQRSRRILAMHEWIECVGFVSWVQARNDGFLFPRLHHAQNVASAASKRFVRLFKAAEIHEPITDVFHSLRHSYKDMMADSGISLETAEKQLGHTPKTQTGAYGSQILRPKEIKRLQSLELPEGLNLEPYYKVLDQVLYYGRLVSPERYERDLPDRFPANQAEAPTRD